MIPAIEWQQPQGDVLKWNVDGTAKGKPGRAGIGGILRNSMGAPICTFSAHIGIRDSNEAEFIAIVFAQETLLMGQNMIEESDSKNKQRGGSIGISSITSCLPLNGSGLHIQTEKVMTMLTVWKKKGLKWRA